MESYKAKNLPFDYIMSNEIFKLLLDAREAYGEYKGFLKNMAFDYKCFLEYALINDIYYSFKNIIVPITFSFKESDFPFQSTFLFQS